MILEIRKGENWVVIRHKCLDLSWMMHVRNHVVLISVPSTFGQDLVNVTNQDNGFAVGHVILGIVCLAINRWQHVFLERQPNLQG